MCIWVTNVKCVWSEDGAADIYVLAVLLAAFTQNRCWMFPFQVGCWTLLPAGAGRNVAAQPSLLGRLGARCRRCSRTLAWLTRTEVPPSCHKPVRCGGFAPAPLLAFARLNLSELAVFLEKSLCYLERAPCVFWCLFIALERNAVIFALGSPWCSATAAFLSLMFFPFFGLSAGS